MASAVGRLVVFGCSLTRDHYIQTWADILGSYLSKPLDNQAQRGAGYQYITHRVMSYDWKSDDVCVIMWPSADRFDLWVDQSTPHLQDDVGTASWLDGASPRLVDNHGVYNGSTGWLLNGAAPRGYKHHYYRFFYSPAQHINHAWCCVIACQAFLQQRAVPTVMCNTHAMTRPLQYHDDRHSHADTTLLDRIDSTMFVPEWQQQGFLHLAQQQGFGWVTPWHPSVDAHQWYCAQYLVPKVSQCF